MNNLPSHRTETLERAGRVLVYIAKYKTAHDGNSPSVREITCGVGLSSTSVTTYYLRLLERAGMIEWDQGLARTIRLVTGERAGVPPDRV